ERLREVMHGVHGHLMLIEHRGEVVRMHAFYIERENAEPPLARLDHAEIRDARQPVDAVAGQRLLVFEDVVAPELLDEVDRRAEPDRAGDVGRTCLEPVRRGLKLALLESDNEYHLAAPLPGRHLREQLVAAVKPAGAGLATS